VLANPVTEADLSMTSWSGEQTAIPSVTDNDIRGIAALKELQRLSLRGMPVTDDCVDQLSQFRRLKHLDVWDTQFPNRGWQS